MYVCVGVCTHICIRVHLHIYRGEEEGWWWGERDRKNYFQELRHLIVESASPESAGQVERLREE